MTTAMPPRWAETILLWTLPERDRDTVSGDLVEDYRDAVVPARGKEGADRWYIRQVAGFVARTYGGWAGLLALMQIIRNVYDLLVPTLYFFPRSAVTTYTAMSLFFAAGFWTAWRTKSLASAIVASLAISAMALVINAVGNGMVLAVLHDPATMANARNSGGVAEGFVIPVITAIPGLVLAAAGGLTSRAAAHMRGLRRDR